MSVRSLITVAILVTVASFALAQTAVTAPTVTPTTGPGVSVESLRSVRVEAIAQGLQVEVEQQTPLSAVVAALCRQQQLKCGGADTLASFQIPPMQVEGKLRQVLSKLLEGTNVNYSISRSAQGAPTEVTFLGSAPRGVAVAPSTEVNTVEQWRTPPPPMHSIRFDPALAQANREAQRASGIEPGQPSSTNANEIQKNQQAMQDVLGGNTTVATQPTEVQPVPDTSTGSGSNSPALQPYPDALGKPTTSDPSPKARGPVPAPTPNSNKPQ